MSNGFYIVTFILSATFIMIALEKLFTLFIKKKNILEKYEFKKDLVFALIILELFGGIAIWMKYSLIGSLGVITLGCLSIGSIYYNLKHRTFKESMPAWFSLFFSITILMEYMIVQ